MNNRIAVFDLDDTLCDFGASFSKFLSQRLNQPEREFDNLRWSSYDLTKFYPEIQDIHDEFVAFEKSGEMAHIKPTAICDYARRLKSWGFKNHIVTARGWMRSPGKITIKWLKDNDVPFDVLDIVGLRECKSKYIKPNSSFLFEDNAKHIQNCADKIDGLIYLVDRPWNQEVEESEKIIRINPNTGNAILTQQIVATEV